MSYFTKERTLFLIIIILVLVNIGSIGSIWLWKLKDRPCLPPPPPQSEKQDGRKFLTEELKLNPSQVEKFEALREEHFKLTSKYNEEMRKNKDDLFSLLNQNVPDSNKASEIASKIGELQKQIDIATFNHFAKLREICDDTQKTKFGKIIEDVLRKMAPPPPHPPGAPPQPPPGR